MKKSTPQEVAEFRTTLRGVCAICEPLKYATATSWTRLYKLYGARGHKRYGQSEIFKFHLIGTLSRAGFSVRQIQAVMSQLSWMVDRASGGDGYFVIYAIADDECKIFDIGADRFAAAVEIASSSGRLFAALSFTGLATDVRNRIQSFLDRVPFVSAGEKVGVALSKLAAEKKREALIHGE